MLIPLAMLAILAFVVIRSLMGVVAHEDVVPAPAALAVEAFTTDRSRDGDGLRAFLLPASGDAVADDDVTVDLNAADASAV